LTNLEFVHVSGQCPIKGGRPAKEGGEIGIWEMGGREVSLHLGLIMQSDDSALGTSVFSSKGGTGLTTPNSER